MSAAIQIRGATLDDLPRLIELWALERLPVSDYERRFKEFQVAQGADGEILGVIGLQILGHEVRIHSEAFARFEMADDLRRHFWGRFKVMGDSQGWSRVWTDCSSQPWLEAGFNPANNEQLSRLPDTFASGSKGVWRVIQLRIERAHVPPIDAEFQLLKVAQQSENERLMRRVRKLKIFSLVIAFGVLAWAGWWGFKIWQARDQILHR